MRAIIRSMRCLIGLGIVFFTHSGLADDSQSVSWLNDFQFHGFVAQSYLHTDHNNFFGESEDGSYDFQELGVNTLWRPMAKLQLAAQLVSRDAGKTDDGDPRFDYAFVDYAILNSETGASGVRIGRVVNPYGFYNDTRDIAATRPSILLPQSVYFDVNRNFALSSDGIHFYHQSGDQSGYYNIQFGIFEPRTQDPDFEPAIFFDNVPGELQGATSWMGRILYEYDLGRLRLGLTVADVNADYDPGPGDPIQPGEFHLRPYMLSFQYSWTQWSLVMEYVRRTVEREKFGALVPDAKFTGSGYYIQTAYRISDKWELFLRYDDLVWDHKDRDGKQFAAATGGLLPNYMRFARDWAYGAKWDVNRYFMLRAEWHRVTGTGWLSLLENRDPSQTEEDWNLFTFSISARF